MAADASATDATAHEPCWNHLGGDLAQLLMRRPRISDVCRWIVLTPPWPQTPRGAVILRCQDDGYLEILGWFGYPAEQVEAYRRMSLFDHLPLTTAARTGASVALHDAGQLAASYPRLAEQIAAMSPRAPGALVAVPMVSPLGPLGVLGMSFETALDPRGPTVPVLESLVPLLGLFQELATPPGSPAPPIPGTADAEAGQAMEPAGLTARQSRVLGMLGKKMSNRDIALALDYSVSTIRLDTMAIFRFLGVANRRGAVEDARRRGLLPPARPSA